MKNNIDSTICPLCEQSNCCDVDSSMGCWCMNTHVPEALIAKIPKNLKDISCVCNQCIVRYQKASELGYHVK